MMSRFCATCAREVVALAALFTFTACGPAPAPRPSIRVEGKAVEALPVRVGTWVNLDIAEGTLRGADADADAVELETTAHAVRVRVGYGAPAEVHLTLSVEDTAGAVHELVLLVEHTPLVWRDVTPETVPPGREYANWWVDPHAPDTAVLAGGFVYEPSQFTPSDAQWTLDLSTLSWQEARPSAPLPASGGAGVALGPEGAVVRFGGLQRDGDDFVLPFSLLAQSADGWAPIEPLDAPRTGVYQPAFFYVDALSGYVALGGNAASGVTMDAALYIPEDDTWQSLALGTGGPSARTGFAWGYASASAQAVLFGGDTDPSGTCAGCAGDTWRLDFTTQPPSWHAIDGEGPTARRNPAFVYEPTGARLWVFGGTPDGRTSAPGLWALELGGTTARWRRALDGTTARTAEPAARTSGHLLYDGVRDRLLLGFGNGSQGVSEDLWVLPLGAGAR